MKIGYLAQKYPQLTLTFVYREIVALRAAGLNIETFSIWKPRLEDLSAEAQPLRAETFYVFPLDWYGFIVSHLRHLFLRPDRYLGTLIFCLMRPHRLWRNRLRTLLHFCQAVYLAREVERRGIAHMHVHFALNAATLALVIQRLTGITYSFTAHANDLFVNPILLPEKIEEARFIIAISEYNRRFMYDLVPTPATAAKIHLVRYGVDVERFAPMARRPQTSPPLILAVARLVEKKGFSFLVKACRILAEQGRDFRCLIIGSGPQEALLRKLIATNQLSDKVELVGRVFQERLKDYLNQATVFVLPCIVAADGDRDGIPNTLIEAMAMEIPVVSTAVSGIPELTQHGQTGLVVAPQDEVALATALAQLLDDEALRARLATAGRATVVAEYEAEKNAAALLGIFRACLEPGWMEALRGAETQVGI